MRRHYPAPPLEVTLTTIASQEDAHRIAGGLQLLENEARLVLNHLRSHIHTALPEPPELAAYISAVENLKGRFSGHSPGSVLDYRLDIPSVGLVRAAIAKARRAAAGGVLASQQKLLRAEQSDALATLIAPFDSLLSLPWLKEVIPAPNPLLSDYVSVAARDAILGKPSFASEARDPKHSILYSASMLSQDLEALRSTCESRRRPLAVAFADLDNFKAFNSELSETRVDRIILPAILEAVEAASFGHGRPYRHGGDEFVFLLPNCDAAMAQLALSQVAVLVNGLRFESVKASPSLSIGVWITAPGSHLTDPELIERAAQAKAQCKAAGKKCITIHIEKGSIYEEIVTRAE